MAEFVMLTFDTTYGAAAALSGVRALEEREDIADHVVENLSQKLGG